MSGPYAGARKEDVDVTDDEVLPHTNIVLIHVL
jgi:hypothetical protein